MVRRLPSHRDGKVVVHLVRGPRFTRKTGRTRYPTRTVTTFPTTHVRQGLGAHDPLVPHPPIPCLALVLSHEGRVDPVSRDRFR